MRNEPDSTNKPAGAAAASVAAAGDAAGWAITGQLTGTGMEQLRYLLSQPAILTKMSQRFDNLAAPNRQGHVFEWAHELSANLNAIAQGETARARVTTWLGQPHDKADLKIFAPDGRVVGEYQAKVLAAGSRLSAHGGLADPKYAGMELLVPEDHARVTDGLLGRRLDMPSGPYHERYADVRARITDRVTVGEASSDPISSERLAEIDRNPKSFLDDLTLRNEIRQVVTAGAAAGVVSATVSVASQLVTHRAGTGSFAEVPWTQVATRAAADAARRVAVSMAGQAIKISSARALAAGATGATGTLAQGFSEGSAAFALANGIYSCAVAAHGKATGRLSSQEAALAAVDGIVQSTALWACSAVGQLLIPVPIVGALVGGIVGQYGASMISQGLQFAIVARAESREWDRAYAELLAHSEEIERQSRAEIEELRTLAAQYESAFSAVIVPALERLNSGAVRNPDDVLRDLADITTTYGGSPVFTSMVEFDEFMNDRNASLVLRLRR